MDLRKKPLFQVKNPFTGELHHVRVIGWDRERKLAHVVDGYLIRRTIPWAYFRWVECGTKLAA